MKKAPNQRAKLKWLLVAALLAVISEVVLWTLCGRYGKMIDNDEWNTLGTITFSYHVPGQMIREVLCPSYPESENIGIPIIVTTGAIQFFLAYWCLLTVGLYIKHVMRRNKHVHNRGTSFLGQSG